MSDDKGLKRFNGEADDPGKDLKRWKAWALAKCMTMKDLKSNQRGPWLFTLLDGAAYETVEHLSLDEIAVEDGDKKIWEALHNRFPEKEKHDQMGEALGEVFSLVAPEGESSKQWTARVKETFERCRRKAETDFPKAARGWITLNCAGLTEQEKAIIKAKTQGSLDYDDIAAAFRSCFPAFKASGSKARKPIGALMVDPDADGVGSQSSPLIAAEEDSFADVEAFLADFSSEKMSEELSEEETAEALAVAWKDRRKEMQQVQQSRRFGSSASSAQSRKTFSVEIEELKKRTRCRKCGKIGHWSRECRSAAVSNRDGAAASSAAGPPPASADLAQLEVVDDEITFVGAAQIETSWNVFSAGLISSPGWGVIDTGCGRTLIGSDTLQTFNNLLNKHGRASAIEHSEKNRFRFGNGQEELSEKVAKIPVAIQGKVGIIDAAVISGQAPLLLGRPTLEKLNVCLNFEKQTMKMLQPAIETAMITNDAGQLLVDLMQFQPKSAQTEPPSSMPSIGANDQAPKAGTDERAKSKKKVTLKKKECRCLVAQLENADYRKDSKFQVAELFSPPRFTLEVEKHGGKGLAFDIKQGWDLLNPKTQDQVEKLLDRAKPKLLIACPTCTHCGGWENLNQYYRTPLERAQLIRRNRARLRFCVRQIHRQLQRGGDFLLEHPWPSQIWNSPELQSLKRRYGVFRIDMCAFDLKCPDTGLFFQKGTGLMVSNRQVPDRLEHMCRCPKNHEHRPIEGQLRGGQRVSSFVATYTPKFVKTMLRAFRVGQHDHHATAVNLHECHMECLAVDADDPSGRAPDAEGSLAQESNSEDDAKIKATLAKLHRNLGHPSTQDMCRILRHSRASDRAIQLAGPPYAKITSSRKVPFQQMFHIPFNSITT